MQAENMGEYTEAAAPEADNIAHQADHEATQAQELIQGALSEDTNSKPKDSEQDRNWRAMRERVEQLQREAEKERSKREEYEQLIYQQLSQQQKQPEPQEVDEFADMSADDWMTYEQSKRLSQKLAEKTARDAVEKALAEDRAKRAEQDLPVKLRTQFQDFDAIVTEDNVKQLKELEPEVALALSQIGDKYAQAVAAYKYIKKFVPDGSKSSEYKERVEKNAQKPGTLSGQSSALSKAQNFERGLTPEMRKQLYAEMVQASKGG